MSTRHIIRRRVSKSFPWTGICWSCKGSSSPYKLKSGQLSRRTVAVEVDGAKQRVEVCPPCRNRMSRNGKFEPVGHQAKPTKPEILAKVNGMLKLGMHKSAIARAMGMRWDKVQKIVRELQPPAPTQNSVEG